MVGTDPLKTISYGYNSADELTGEVATGGDPAEAPLDNDYVYDKMGNRTASQHLTQANSYNVAYANNNLNQTTGRVGSGAGAPAFTESLVYDALGNLREWGDKRLTPHHFRVATEISKPERRSVSSHLRSIPTKKNSNKTGSTLRPCGQSLHTLVSNQKQQVSAS